MMYPNSLDEHDRMMAEMQDLHQHFSFPHVKYLETHSTNPAVWKNNCRLLYYIGDAYPVLERLRKYQVRIIRYSPEKGMPYEDVWLVMDPYTVQDMLDKDGNRIHVDLSQFTEDLSKWRDGKIESIVDKKD